MANTSVRKPKSAAKRQDTACQTGNGALVYKVRVTAGYHKGRLLTFTKHSPDRYTVFGLSELAISGISIEKRKGELEVLLHDSGHMLTLGEDVEWIAHSYLQDRGYYGVLGVGRTAEEAYKRTFNRFNS
jgi:hypothetical protein